MKNLLSALVLFLVPGLLGSVNLTLNFLAAESSPKNGVVKDGWIDENTFQIQVHAALDPGIKDEEKRKKVARMQAVQSAQFRILEKFKGARLEGAAGAADYSSTGIAVIKEFQGMVKLGRVIEEDCGENGCRILYQVNSPGLKKKVIAGTD